MAYMKGKFLMDTGRKVRIGIGAVIIISGLVLHADWWIIGLLPFITGILNACPGGSCKVPEPKAGTRAPEITKELE